ncbi:TRAP transporter large permease [Oceanibacterium hippocampi]|uniref:Sialic acid TRAP transporter permease protein SiaT n=1 Tax=Oceanibacterium hippocampi TaxID=745714 RepID=A0A1Y5SMU3_9PROT|nr:TRAP transporter large permease subunit [Oceanibacterium hippocampi]SLN44380.1 Sialic acid TRAP transporter permease protein SiaT [Oceanibacterium hippocampi]
MLVNEIFAVILFASVCACLMAGFPVAFTLSGVGLAVGVVAYFFGVFDMTFLSAMPQRIFGNAMWNEVLIAVPLFVFMGVMLERSKVAEELLDTMGMLFGPMRGGLGLSVFTVGALLAASTGIVGATVVTMGLLSLPTMLRRGYDPKLACGAICASGTLGQIIPPSIVLVILGDQISNAYVDAQRAIGNWSPEPVSVGDLFAGAMLPGLMLVGMYMLYQIIIANVRPESSPAIPREALGEGTDSGSFGGRVVHALVPPVVLIIAVLGSILAGYATPTEAAAVGAVGALLLAGLRLDESHGGPIYVSALSLVAMLLLASYFDLRMNLDATTSTNLVAIGAALIFAAILLYGVVVSLIRVYRTQILHTVMRSTMEISAMVFVILIGAAMFSLVFRGLGGDDMVHELLTNMPGGRVGAIIVVMAVMFLLGFFLDFIEITFVVVPIVAPIILQLDVNPIWLGIMMAMNLQTSFLTPPFGFALFYLRGVAPPEVTTMHIYKGVIPFVAIQIIGLIVLAQFPEIATWLPKVVFGTDLGN